MNQPVGIWEIFDLYDLWFWNWPNPLYIKVKRMWNVSSLSLHRLKCIISCHHCRVAASVDPRNGTEFPLNQLVCLRVMTYQQICRSSPELFISIEISIFLVDLTFIFPRYCRSTCRSTYPPVHGKLGNPQSWRESHRTAAQLPLEAGVAGSWNRCWFEAKRGETLEICEVGFSAVFTAPSGNLTAAIEHGHFIVSFPINNGDFP